MKAECRGCGQERGVCKDGTIRSHLDPQSLYYPRTYCAGSRDLPASLPSHAEAIRIAEMFADAAADAL